jgi:hypothetical protein
MAQHTVRVCDFESGACQAIATCYKVWREGERQAWSVDLCEEHAQPLLLLLAVAERSDLPTKPRVKMEATKLRTTASTRPFKK